MPIELFFSLTPKEPRWDTRYTAHPPDAPNTWASLVTVGGYTAPNRLELERQYEDDEILLGPDAVAADNTGAGPLDDRARHCGAFITWNPNNVVDSNQYLVIFRLRYTGGGTIPVAQFFIGEDLIRTDPITSDPYDEVGFVIEAPGSNMIHTWVRLASENGRQTRIYFKRFECWLISP